MGFCKKVSISFANISLIIKDTNMLYTSLEMHFLRNSYKIFAEMAESPKLKLKFLLLFPTGEDIK